MKQLVSSITPINLPNVAWSGANSYYSSGLSVSCYDKELEARAEKISPVINHYHTINDRAAIGVDRYDIDIPIRYGNEGDAPFLAMTKLKNGGKRA